MSALDDLLDLGGPSTTQTGGQLMDPFDPLGSSGTGENTGGGGDTLLDFGFDAPTSTQNGSSAKLNFEANTNPLYEFTSAESKMSADASSPLFELNSDAPQKEAKQEPSNPLYDFVQNEDTNGHGEDIIVNGDQEQNGGKQEVDLLGAGDSGNLLGDSGDLLGDSGPITSDDSGVTVDSNNVSGEQPREETEDVVETVEEEQDQAEPVKEEIPESTESVTDTQVEQSGPEDTNKGPEPEVLDTPDQGTKAEEEKQTSDMAKDDSEPAVVDNQAENVTDESKETATEVADAKEPEVEQGKEDDAASDGPELQEEGTEQFEDADPEEAKAPVEHVEEPVEAVQSESVEAEQPNGAEGEVPTEQKTEVEETKPEQIPEPVQTENEAQEPEPVVEEVQTETVDAPVETAPEPVVEPEGNQEVETVPEESKPEPPKEEVEVAQEQVEEPAAPVEPVETKDGDAVEEQATTEALKPTEETPAEETPAVETPAVETPTLVQVEEKPVEVIEEKQDTPVEEPEPPVENVAKPAEVEQPETADTPETLDIGDEGTSETRQSETVAKETRTSTSDENALKLNGTSDVKENGVEGEDAVRDPNVFRETREKEEVHFAEMNNVRQKFESGGASTQEETSPRTISLKDDYDQGGEFENEPVRNPDVVRETDQPGEELPEIGMAKNLRDRFQTIQEEKAKPVASSKRVSPPRSEEKVEYESTPTEHQVLDDVKVDEGVFESQPAESENVVRSGEVAEDFTPEKGSAKNILNKFKEIQTEGGNYKSDQKREITPDRSGKVEYVSEPRGEHITYEETKTDSGVFENVPKQEEDVVRSEDRADEVMPESGMAKNLLSKFKQMETEAGNKPPPSPGRVREITPDRSGKVEFVSEPRGFLEKYEPQNESGEFENQPATRPEVIRSEDHAEDVMPESGTAKKTMERFRELQKQSTSPSNKSKEFTPPRETSPGRSGSGVYESTPEARPDVVRSGESVEEELPEQGTTRNILNKFKEIQTSGSQSSSPGRKQKEFTPPPESGVYENKPDEHLIIETRQSESGILESTPVKSTADVARERDSVSPESELPEQGLAKNLVSKWKQLESSSASAKSTSSTSPRFKEFTPPRDSRGPMSPKSPAPTDSGKTNGVHPSELPGQYQPQIEASILENNPEVRTGVTREADTDWEKDMPAPNTTSSMLQKFKSIQQKAKDDSSTPAPVTRKEKGMFRVVQTEKCSACEKTVYAMEKLEMNGHIYHKQCFKCSHCSARLTPKTFSMNEGIIYCVNHFKQLFARKGNYDEGFGRQQYKKKWQDEKKEGATA